MELKKLAKSDYTESIKKDYTSSAKSDNTEIAEPVKSNNTELAELAKKQLHGVGKMKLYKACQKW